MPSSALDLERWRLFARRGNARQQPGARLLVPRFGQLQPDDAVRAPRDAAPTDRRVEKGEAVARHGRKTIACTPAPNLANLAAQPLDLELFREAANA
jgi:hypothetical protein